MRQGEAASSKTIKQIIKLHKDDPELSHRQIAEQIGVHRSTVDKYIKLENIKNKSQDAAFVLSDVESADRTPEEIIEAKIKKFNRVRRHYESKGLQQVKINIDGPIGIAHFGDPHLDDDGCDIEMFERHMRIVRDTEGLFAGNIGDLTNNWVGRLAAKYADQTTTQSEAWSLIEWMMQYMPWLYIIAGNHDVWSGSHDPVSWIARHLDQPYIPHGVRLNLSFPKGSDCILHIAHNFPGHSQWNTNHGATKKAWKYPEDEILVCGHLHHTGYAVHPHPVSGKLQHLIRCDSYKIYDDYPTKLGIDESFVAPCPITVIDPRTENPAKRIKVFFNTTEGAEYLTWLRSKP